MSALVPRFSGNAVQSGKHWTWELFIRIGEGEPVTMVNKELFLNKNAALTDLQKHLPGIMEITCEAMGLPKPQGVHDLNRGVVDTVEDWSKKKLS